MEEFRDDVQATAVQRESGTGSDDIRDDAESIKSDSESKVDSKKSSSYDIPEIKSTESEKEFEDVLAELNATESGDGSMQELLGASSSETDVMTQNDDASIDTAAKEAVKKLIDSIKSEAKIAADNETVAANGVDVNKSGSIGSETDDSVSTKAREAEKIKPK
jgi:hypothetical protein